MAKLRQRMDDAMVLRGFALRTRESYLAAVSALAKHYHRAPDVLTAEEVQAWLLHLVDFLSSSLTIPITTACHALQSNKVYPPPISGGLLRDWLGRRINAIR